MAMNTKNKKIIASVAGVAVGLVIIGNMLFAPINATDNEYVQLISSISSVKDNVVIDKSELLELQNEMNKSSQDKDKIIQIDKIIEEMEKENYLEDSKINDHIKQIDQLNEEIDSMIASYNEDENMKKDMIIVDKFITLEGLDRLVDSCIERHNTEHAPKFNEAIKKFPVSVIAKEKGWFEVDMFTSIK